MQIVEFEFLAGYTLLVDTYNIEATLAIDTGIATSEIRQISGGVARYQFAVTGYAGHYYLEIKASGLVLMSDRVTIPTTADGTYYVESLKGLTLPQPNQVTIGVDRGDGVRGTLIPCFDPERTVDSEFEVELVAKQVIEVLSLTGGRTNVVGKITNVLPNNMYEILLDNTSKRMVFSRDRLQPIYPDN